MLESIISFSSWISYFLGMFSQVSTNFLNVVFSIEILGSQNVPTQIDDFERRLCTQI